MRRIILIMISFIFSFIILTGRIKEQAVVGAILENNETSLLIQEDSSDEKYFISIQEDTMIYDTEENKISVDELSVDTKVWVDYGGHLEKGDPNQIDDCIQIKIRE